VLECFHGKYQFPSQFAQVPANSTHGRLRGETGKIINSNIYNIRTSLGSSQHARGGDTSRIVRVNVNGQVGVSLSDSSNEDPSGFRFKQPGHVLDTQDVDPLSNELIRKIEVVLQGIFGPFRVGDVSRVTDCTFDYTACLLRSVDTELEVLKVIERVEYTENIQTSFYSFFGEFVYGIVRV